MHNPNIGIQKVVIKQGDERNDLRIEMIEEDYRTLLFINSIRNDKVYSSPQAAYEAAAKLLKLAGTTVDLNVDVACNVMEVAEVEQAFWDSGVNVHSVITT